MEEEGIDEEKEDERERDYLEQTIQPIIITN